MLRNQLNVACVAAFFAAFSVSLSGLAQLGFTEMATAYQLQNTYVGESGAGVSFADFNGDHLDDITFATRAGEPLKVYQNTGSGFLEIPPPVTDYSDVKQVNWVDIDNDGDKDLYLSINGGPSRLFECASPGTYTDITTAAGIDLSTYAFGSCWGDLNGDGYLDLFVNVMSLSEPCRLYMNNGNNTFTDASVSSGIADNTDFAFCAVMFDYDNDNDLDIYISNDKVIVQNKLWENDGTGHFTNVSNSSGAGIWIDAMSATVGDYNQDGFFDLYISNEDDGNNFLHNNGNGTFVNIAPTNGTMFSSLAWGSQFLDADNDLDIDIYVSGEESINYPNSAALFENDGTNNYSIATNIGMDGDTLHSFGNAIGDLNNDGFIDIVVNNTVENCLLFQNNGNQNHWLKVNLEGTLSNRDGIGSVITVGVGGVLYRNFTNCGEGYLGQNSLSEFFGLGSYTTVDSLSVLWPSGQTDVFYNIAADQNLFILEGSSVTIDNSISVQQPLVCTDSTVELSGNVLYDFLWSTGDTTNSISVSANGSYYAILTNNFGISVSTDTLDITVEWPDATVLTSVTNESCFGAGNGTASLSITSTPTGSVIWDSGDTTFNVSNLGAGYHSFWATDAVACTVYDSVLIQSPPALLLSVLSTQETSTQSGSASVFVWGGTPPYSYLWNDPQAQTTSDATGLSGGTYSVWVTDAHGCVDSAQVVVTSTLSLPEIALNYSVYPNPAQTYFSLQGLNVGSIQLLSMEGKVVREWHHPPTGNHYSIEPVPQGVYLIRIMDSMGTVHHASLVKN